MSSLIERSGTIQSTLIDRGRHEVGLQVRQQLTQWKDRVDEVTAGINASIELERRLREASVDVAPIDKAAADGAKAARSNLRRSATRLDVPELSDEETLKVLGGKPLEDALKIAETVVSRARGRIGKALEDERQALIPKDLHEPLPDVPGQAARLGRLDLCRRRLQEPVEVRNSDLTPEGIESVLAGRSKRADDLAYWNRERPVLQAELEKEDPAVQRFLHAVASDGGAPLALLTDKVRSRLEENGTLDDFRIHRP